MRYPGYEVETVANPWVFADLSQPQRFRGSVSPIVFQTGTPGAGDPYLDAALRAIQGDMGEVGARLPRSVGGMGNYDLLGAAEPADRMQVHPAGMRLEADVVPRGISAAMATRAQQQLAQRLGSSPLLQPVRVAWGSGAHAGKIHVIAVTRSANLTAWEILSEMRAVAAQASDDLGVSNGLTVPTIAYQAGTGTVAPMPGQVSTFAPALATKGASSSQASSASKTGQTVIDALLLDPPPAVVTAESSSPAVPGWALGIGAVLVTGGVLYALRRGGGA